MMEQRAGKQSEFIVAKDFVIRFQRNANVVRAGAVLISEDGEYFRLRTGELALLLEIDAIDRLRRGGFLELRPTRLAA